MLQFRLRIVLLILWLFLFYNIERINEPIDIASFVYALIPAAATVILLVPRLFGRKSFVFIFVPSLIVYFLLKRLLGYGFWGEALPITVMEIAAISLTLWFVNDIAYISWDVEDTIAHLTFRQIGIPPRLYEGLSAEDLYREVKRSRRYKRPLALLVVRPDFDPSALELNKILHDLQKRMAKRYIQAQLAKLFSEELRDSDLIALQSNEYVIILPEVEAEEAEKQVGRLTDLAAQRLGVKLSIGMADFPAKGITLNGLINAASRNLLDVSQTVGENSQGQQGIVTSSTPGSAGI